MDEDIWSVEGEALLKLDTHPLARFVPESAMVLRDSSSIETPIQLLDGKILDGRARVREAIRLKLSCRCVNINPSHDEHPAIIVGRAFTSRIPQPEAAVRAIVCARIVHYLLLNPKSIEHYDFGMARSLRKRKNLVPMLDAFAISLTTYDRARKILGDAALVDGVMNGMLPLKIAERLVRVPLKRRMELLHLSDDERNVRLERFFARSHKRRSTAQATLDGLN